MPSSWYSTGSSTVMIFFPWRSRVLRRAYSVVDLPLPVGPVTRISHGLQYGLAQLGQIVLGKAQGAQFQPHPLPVQQPEYQGLPVERRQGGNPDIHQAAFPFSLEPAILGQTFFPNIQPRHNLKPGQQRFLEMFGTRVRNWSTPSIRQRT